MNKPVTYLDLVNIFWRKHLEHSFTPNEVAVWFHLLHRCNSLSWKNPFNLSKGWLQLEMKLKTEKPLDTARNALREAGLIDFKNGQGRGITTEYTIVGLTTQAENPTEKGNKNNPFSGAFYDDLPEKAPENPTEKGNKNNPNKGGTTIDREKEEDEEGSSAASAATPSAASPSSFLEGSQPAVSPKKPAAKKKKAASPEEVEALDLPHQGKEFADLWAGFVAGPKQQGKSLLAFRLLLKKLAKYEEGFAIVMLEKAIEGNWSAVEYESTPDAYTKWQADQGRHATSQPTPAIDRDALFGFEQSASDGLAQARNTPEYLDYLAQQQPSQGPATAAELAALPLPHASAEFAKAWGNFLSGPKQAGKALYACELMLRQLGAYPEAFAVLMIEKAIMGNWQGIENAGTARDFLEWKSRPIEPLPSPPLEAPPKNLAFVAMVECREEAKRAGHLAYYGARAAGHSEEEAEQIRQQAEAKILAQLPAEEE